MIRKAVNRTKETAVRVNEVVVPHNGSALLGWKNKIGRVAIDAQVKLICGCFGIFYFLENTKIDRQTDRDISIVSVMIMLIINFHKNANIQI